jgi:hypothetical protein
VKTPANKVKWPGFPAFSLMSNLVLAVILFTVRHGPARVAEAPKPPALLPAKTQETMPPSQLATPAPAPVAPWSLIESSDYRQYVANLRAVGCPDWLMRDMIVADIDDLYQQKPGIAPVASAPWEGAGRRREGARGQTAKAQGLRQEKRALVKALLGYEWEDYAERVWNQDLTASLTLGFLPDDRAAQVLSLKDQYDEGARNIREDANYILIDSDRASLQSLYDGLEGDLSGQLAPSEFEELQLRAQQRFLIANDIHFDGVSISGREVREVVRISKSFKDMARSEYVPDHPASEAEQARQKADFDAQVKWLLGPERFADYERAQDFDFRNILDFSRQNNLPQTSAIAVYEARRTAAAEADEIRKEGDLSPDERATALAVLKAVTARTVSSALGGSYQTYLQASGQWLEALAQTPDAQTQKQ